MFKKILMLASMALALVAVAAPASALAVWTHENNPIEENATETITGKASFNVPASGAGAEAELTAEVELEAGTTTGTVKSISAHGCVGTGTLLGTTCTSTFEGLPWTVHAISNDTLQITNIKIHNHYYALNKAHTPENVVATSTLTGNVLATTDTANKIGTLTLSGQGTIVNGVALAEVSGDMTAHNFNTYGWEAF